MHTSSTAEVPAIKELSAIAAENGPDEVAFGNGLDGRTVTWQEFDDESRRAANAFHDKLAQGDRVALLCENSVEHTTLWNGALKAGCVVTNLHVRASPNTVAHTIDACRPRVLVVDDGTSEFFAERVREKLSTDISVIVNTGEARRGYERSFETFVADKPTTAPDVRVREDDTSVIMWTSGTTVAPSPYSEDKR